MQAISDAYKRVQKVVGKKVTLEDLGKIYDAKKHPEVLTLRKVKKMLLISLFGAGIISNQITLSKFSSLLLTFK